MQYVNGQQIIALSIIFLETFLLETIENTTSEV